MNATHAFVGYRRCGGAMFIGVDDPNEVPFTRGEVVALLRAGGRLERVTLDDARKTPLCFGCEGCA